MPQGLKPSDDCGLCGTTKVVPCYKASQNLSFSAASKAAASLRFQTSSIHPHLSTLEVYPRSNLVRRRPIAETMRLTRTLCYEPSADCFHAGCSERSGLRRCRAG